MFPAWLARPLNDLGRLGERMPHAVLIHGQAGVGKRVLGRALARRLLCESVPARQDGAGCGACPACLWFDQGNHPDFRRLTSDAIAASEGAADDESDDESSVDEGGAQRSSRKTPSKEIRVDQVRGLQRFLSVATHRGAARVVLLYPLEALNAIGANALLKMLEEPPPRTVFILVADHLDHVAPTVVSRCRKVPVATPPRADALAWLAGQGAADAEETLALCGGAPFAALELARDPAALEAHRDLVAYLAAPGAGEALSAAEAFGRRALAPLVGWMQLWLADCISMRMTASIRYHPAQSRVIARLAGAARPAALFGLEQRLTAVRRTVEHPLNVRLVLEGLLTAYADVMAPAGP